MRLKLFLVFAGLFFAGVFAGAVFEREFLQWLMPAIRYGLGIGEKMSSDSALNFPIFLLIFAKNVSVAAMCISLARPSRGAVPAVVCASNGLVVGVLGALLAAKGIPPWYYAALLAPHGMIELPALFLACALGLTINGNVLARLRRGTPVVAGMFAVAAAVEVWVSPLVGKLLG
ncbi:stage II sporulation protein M [Desulfofundulus sp. TPOSR]|uniref:stage II sporulation protein M n=1 Tax=Desulfofundulus sp. TPOSR TaxID=2714340 RepID=UPI00140D2D90|nr:stage II sporulation protein M [Desulfofundulus sp. TPOSR]NHM28072.1 stage II sporulation protein M [Desulfofundulus sp. TPOSR]